MVLNRGQAYWVNIEEKTPTQSFCIFFARDLAIQVWHGSHSALFDGHVPISSSPVHFFEKPYALTGKVQQHLLGLQSRLHTAVTDPGVLTELLHGLLFELLLLKGGTRRELNSLRFVRLATREKLYRRLHRAREYIYTCYRAPLTLQELAEVACLSPNHLLRTFRQLFGQSPFEMISRLRLEKAEALLMATDGPVSENLRRLPVPFHFYRAV